VSISADRQVNPDYGVLLRAVTTHGREIVRGEAAGNGRTDVISTGLRYPKAESDEEDVAPETVCLQVSNSFSAAAGVKTTPGLPLELTVDIVDGPDQASDVASFGLGRGWWLLGALVLTGFLAGVLWGWISRWRFSVWRTN
jgi:Ca-activated chloride channel family protein